MVGIPLFEFCAAIEMDHSDSFGANNMNSMTNLIEYSKVIGFKGMDEKTFNLFVPGALHPGLVNKKCITSATGKSKEIVFFRCDIPFDLTEKWHQSIGSRII